MNPLGIFNYLLGASAQPLMTSELLDQKLEELEGLAPNIALLNRVMDLQQHKNLRDDAPKRIDDLMQSILQSAPKPRALPSGHGPTQPSGTIGLKNSGTDCFMNVLVQGLFGDPELREIILGLEQASPKDLIHIEGQESSVSSYMQEVKQLIWEYTEAIRKGEKKPLTIGTRLRKTLQIISKLAGSGAKNFDNGFQHDPPEALQRFFLPFNASPLTPELVKHYTLEDGFVKKLEGTDRVFPLTIEITSNDTTTCAFEDQLECYLTERNVSGLVLRKDDESSDQPVTKGISKFTARPEHLLVQFKRFDNGNTKIDTKIYLKETFFIHPKHVEGDQGGEYKIRWFVVHKGGTEGGHYYMYRKVGNDWYRLNDRTVTKMSHWGTFHEDLRSCYFFFAKRIANSNKNIDAEIQARQEESFPIEIEDTLKKKDEVKSLNLFRKALEKKSSNEEELEKIFQALPHEAQAFFQNFMEKGEPLTTLNAVQCKLTSDRAVIDHIVAQYQWLRKQHAELAKLDRRYNQIYRQTLEKAEYEIEAKRAHLTYQDQCYNHLATVSKEYFPLVAHTLLPGKPPTLESRESDQKRASEALENLEKQAEKLQKLQEEIQHATTDIFSELAKI